MKRILLLLIILPLFCQAAMYRWEENGVVHYSDKPVKGADKIKTPVLQTYEPPPIPVAGESASVGTTVEKKQPENYRSISLLTPAHDGTVRNTVGHVDVNVVLEPELFEGHKFNVLLDGKPAIKPHTAYFVTLINVDRGMHKLQVEVMDHKKNVVLSTKEVTFYMHRTRKNQVQGP